MLKYGDLVKLTPIAKLSFLITKNAHKTLWIDKETICLYVGQIPSITYKTYLILINNVVYKVFPEDKNFLIEKL